MLPFAERVCDLQNGNRLGNNTKSVLVLSEMDGVDLALEQVCRHMGRDRRMIMPPRITIDTTNDTAGVAMTAHNDSMVHVHGLKLGETGHLTMDQVDQHARSLAKQALHAAIAQL